MLEINDGNRGVEAFCAANAINLTDITIADGPKWPVSTLSCIAESVSAQQKSSSNVVISDWSCPDGDPAVTAGSNVFNGASYDYKICRK